jgi:excisionase family DNA binding protein
MNDAILLTTAQVADRFQIDERTITRWLRDGFLSGYKLGKEWRIASNELESFLHGHANRPRND